MGRCYELSEAWPKADIERNPFLKKFGRMAVYFNCIKKVVCLSF